MRRPAIPPALHPRKALIGALVRGLSLPLAEPLAWGRHILSLLVVVHLLGLAGAEAAPPQRIVSLNVCTDQILVDLVPKGRIAAVTHLATDPLTSAKPERAAGIMQTRGGAEDVVALKPDLVLVGEYSTPATTDLLRRLGVRVEAVALPQSIAGVRDVIRRLATLLDEPTNGETLIADMDRRIAAAERASLAPPPRALIYQVNNFVAREGSLVDEAMRLAGFANAAQQLHYAHGGQVGVEDIILSRPDVLIVASGPDAYRTTVADNLRHPALLKAKTWKSELLLPWPLWLCATHHVADAIERLAAARDALTR